MARYGKVLGQDSVSRVWKSSRLAVMGETNLVSGVVFSLTDGNGPAQKQVVTLEKVCKEIGEDPTSMLLLTTGRRIQGRSRSDDKTDTPIIMLCSERIDPRYLAPRAEHHLIVVGWPIYWWQFWSR